MKSSSKSQPDIKLAFLFGGEGGQGEEVRGADSDGEK